MLEWYVAKVKPRNEYSVQSYLQRNGVEIYTPDFVVTKRGKQRLEPLFPGYAFVRMDPRSEQWPLVRWTPGLSFFLPAKEKPMAIPDSLIEELHSRVEKWNAGGWVTGFEPGDRIFIVSGAIKGLDAIFERYIPGRQRCEVLIWLMSRPHRIKVNMAEVHSSSARQRFAQLGVASA